MAAANPISYELAIQKLNEKINTSAIGVANGVAGLGADGKVPLAQLPDNISHDLGYFETEVALIAAHPTATAGDYAIVGETDTIWLWDTDSESWLDSGLTQGVTGVKGANEADYRTGNVNLSGTDIIDTITEAAYLVLTDLEKGTLKYLVVPEEV